MQAVKSNDKVRAQEKARKKKNLLLGLSVLGIDILFSVSAQMVLKFAMKRIGAFEGDVSWLDFTLRLIDPYVITGLGLYALATVLWILCLSLLDLSFAYPVATIQYFLIFLGAWYFFGEQIPTLRIIGLLVITVGVIIISTDKSMR